MATRKRAKKKQEKKDNLCFIREVEELGQLKRPLGFPRSGHLGKPYPPGSPLFGWPKVEGMIITPEMARDWLENHNVRNRKKSPSNIRRLKKILKDDMFIVTSDCIAFYNGFSMFNGQNRANAILEAGKPGKCLVAAYFQIEENAQKYCDRQSTRKPAEDLHIAGYQNSEVLARAIGFKIKELRGTIDAISGKNAHVPIYEYEEVIEKYPSLLYSSAICSDKRLIKYMHKGLAAFLHHEFTLADSKKDSGLADEFFDKIMSGANISPNSPILKLMDKLLKDKASTHRVPEHFAMCHIIKTWNAWIYNKPIKQFKAAKGMKAAAITKT